MARPIAAIAPEDPPARPLFWGLSLASAAVAVILGWGFIGSAAPTYDEPVHLASGYLGLTAGDPLNYRDHPPLAEMWAALPLLRLHLSTLRQSTQWGRLYHYADVFLYLNVAPAEEMLDSARRWCLISWSLLLIPAILAWAAAGGTAAVAAAAVFCAFCPPFASNFSLVTTDAAAAVFYFLTFWLCARRPRTLRSWSLAGLALGAALASKFNMVVLPAFLAAVLLTEGRLTRRSPLRESELAAMILAASLVLAAVYRFTGLPLYWQGLTETIERLGQGRPSFFRGAFSVSGTPWYFPVALAIKTPLPLLLAGALGAVLLLRRPDVETLWLLFPPAAFFALACTSKTQIGYRHILPVYPFLIVLAARGAAWLWRQKIAGRAAAAVLGVWLCAGVLRVHPDYLAYFNEAAGGPAGGYRWLADSNLDWGQGLKGLGAELARRGSPVVLLSYFGVADPSYYGIRYYPLGFVSNIDRRDGVAEPRRDAPVLVAVSATNLQGVYYSEKTTFDFLRKRTPVFTAGHSIFLYDLTGDAEARRLLAALIAATGGSPGVARWLADR